MKTTKRFIAVFVVTLFAIAYFNSEKPEPSSLTQPIVVVGTQEAGICPNLDRDKGGVACYGD